MHTRGGRNWNTSAMQAFFKADIPAIMALEENLPGRQNMGSKGRKNEKKPKKQAEVKKQVGKAPDNSGQKKKF
jgi:hypothetical protein